MNANEEEEEEEDDDDDDDSYCSLTSSEVKSESLFMKTRRIYVPNKYSRHFCTMAGDVMTIIKSVHKNCVTSYHGGYMAVPDRRHEALVVR